MLVTDDLTGETLQAAVALVRRHGELTGLGDPREREGLVDIALDVAVAGDPAELRAEAETLRHTAGAPEVAVLTGELLAGAGLVVTDVDSTLITAEVIELIAERAGTRAEVAAVTERAMRGELDFAESLRQRVATLAGVPDTVFAEVLEQVELSPGATALVAAAKAHGAEVGLVSGGFIEVVAPLAARLGIDRVRANRLEVAEGRLTGRLVGETVTRETKAQTLLEWAGDRGLDPAATVAVGDGANDLAMLAAAGLGVAYRAKPVVVEQADCSIGRQRLDVVARFLQW